MDIMAKCPKTGDEFESGIQAWSTVMTIKNLSVDCPHCGESHTYDMADVETGLQLAPESLKPSPL